MTGKTAIFEVSLEIEKQLGMVKETTDELADQHETLEMSAKEYREQLRTIREIKKLETDQNRWEKSKIDLSLSQNDLSRRAEHEQKRRDNEHKARLLDHLKVIKSIYGVTMSIGKTALFGGIGLVGASLFGMSRLADSTKSDRSTAHQLNKGDIGGLKALENVYGGSIFSDAKSMLGEVKGIMRGDSGYSEMAKLGALLGKSFDELSAMNPVDMLIDGTIASKEFADNLRAAGQGFFVNNPVITSSQLPMMFAENLQDIDSYPLSELKEKREKVKEYQVKLNLDDKPAKGWEDFATARDNMYDAMIKKLKEEVVGLTVPLTELGVSIEKAAVAFLGSELMGDAIEYTTEKLTEFSKYVASDQAKKDWDELRKDAKEAGAMLHEFGVGMRKWGVKLGFFEETQQEKNLRELQESMPEDPFSKSDGTLWGDYKENLENDVGVNAVKGAVSDAGGFIERKIDNAKEVFTGEKSARFADKEHKVPRDIEKELRDASVRNGFNYNEVSEAFNRAGEKSGMGRLEMLAAAYVESRFNPVAKSGVGAEGMMQFMPATAQRFGLKDRKDPVKNIDAAGEYYKVLYDKFGNYDLAHAGYNAGEHRKSLESGHIPDIPETKNHVKLIRAIRKARGSKPPNIFERVGKHFEDTPLSRLAKNYEEHAPTKERANELQVQIDKPEHAPTVDDNPSETKDWKSPILKKLTEDALKRKDYKPPEKHGESETTGGGASEPKIKDYAPTKKPNTIQIPQSRTPTMPYLTLNISNQTGGNVTTEALKY